MELTDTNEPCGLTISFFKQSLPCYFNCQAIFGGHSEEVTPVPIPNTEVKLFSADGTAWETMWESRSPPFFLYQAPAIPAGASFFYTPPPPYCIPPSPIYFFSIYPPADQSHPPLNAPNKTENGQDVKLLSRPYMASKASLYGKQSRCKL